MPPKLKPIVESTTKHVQKSKGRGGKSVIDATNLTPAFIDNVIAKMEKALSKVDKATGVKLPKAETDLLTHIEEARDFMLAVLMNPKDKDRKVLEAILGGDCIRIGAVRAMLESAHFSPMYAADPRPKMCLNSCESVENVLGELGLFEELKAAKTLQKGAFEERKMADALDDVIASVETPVDDTTESPVNESTSDTGTDDESSEGETERIPDHDFADSCVWRVLAASVFESAAIALDYAELACRSGGDTNSGHAAKAVVQYEESIYQLDVLLGTILPELDRDQDVLRQHREQVMRRIEYLKDRKDEEEEVAVEHHIKRSVLAINAAVAARSIAQSARRGNVTARDACQVLASGDAVLGARGFIVLGAASGVERRLSCLDMQKRGVAISADSVLVKKMPNASPFFGKVISKPVGDMSESELISEVRRRGMCIESISAEGWLHIRGPTFQYQFQRRWCVLTLSAMEIYEDDETLTKIRDIRLQPTSIAREFTDLDAPGDAVKHRATIRHGFVLDVNPAAGKERKLQYFDAEDASNLGAWIDALSIVVIEPCRSGEMEEPSSPGGAQEKGAKRPGFARSMTATALNAKKSMSKLLLPSKKPKSKPKAGRSDGKASDEELIAEVRLRGIHVEAMKAQGWLDVRSSKPVYTFEPRWCVLTTSAIEIFEEDESIERLGKIWLHRTAKAVEFLAVGPPGDSVAYRISTPHGFVVDVHPGGDGHKLHYFDARTKDRLAYWIDAISILWLRE